ncbi:response regulator [Brevibacillus sp. SYSU BS000544]|uniref:response regulator n=1 Tax=Brevibacillus sp. SYSU BS000544 TaxID=3416443 RepID=UPI003CE5168F
MIKVVIVEDDPMVAQINKRYLEQVGGFDLLAVVSSADDMLKMLDSKEIDLLLLDIFMPGMNGLELLAEIRKLEKGIDVIVISAACDIPSIKNALRLGAVDYLIKPFEFERFSSALTAYREEVGYFEKQEVVSQEDLDKLILHKDQTVPQAQDELPKGLTRKTLEKVWESILAYNGDEFTTEDLANRIGISRVSMRKYLQFLTEIGVLEMEVTYGTIGRPTYKHRCIQEKCDVIKRYLA